MQPHATYSETDSPRCLLDTMSVGKGSKASWATRPNRRAMVFVHGFRGEAIKTWGSFPRLLAGPDFDGWDVVFFGYESERRQAPKSAEDFKDFLERFAISPGSLMNLTRQARGERPMAGVAPFYEHIYIVAHSLGAAVVRHALIQVHADALWPTRVLLVLYAPAHAGAKSIDSLIDAIPDTVTWARFIARLKLRNKPIVDDLTGKTAFLAQLKERTLERLATGRNLHLIAKAIVDAEFETVVDQVKFIPQDPDGKMIRGTKHTTVCKPTTSTSEPFTRLRALL